MGAFGSGGTSGNDVQIKIVLESGGAQKELANLDKVFEGFIAGVIDGAKDVLNLESGLKKTGAAADKAGDGFTKTQRAIVSFDSTINLLNRSLSAFNKAADLVGRGAAFDDLIGSFQNLSGLAPQAAEALQGQLNTALADTVSNFDLLSRSNDLLLAGLRPDALLTVATAARTLGDISGSTSEAFDVLGRALERGNTELLKRYGITVDAAEAEAKFAKSLGLKELNEAGALEARRAVILEQVTQRTKELGEANIDAGDSFDQAKKKIRDTIDETLRAIATNKDFQDALNSVASAIRGVDPKPLVDAVISIIGIAKEGIIAIKELAATVGSALGQAQNAIIGSGVKTLDSFGVEIEKQLVRLTDDLGKIGTSNDGKALEVFNQRLRDTASAINGIDDGIRKSSFQKEFGPSIERLGKQAADLGKQLGVVKKETASTGKETKTTKTETQKLADEIERLRKKYGSTGTAAKEAADKQKQLDSELESFRSTIQKITGNGPLEELRVDLSRAFAESKSAGELEQKILDIGKAAQKLKVPLNDVAGLVKEFQSGEAVLGPGNAAGLEEFQKQQGKAGQGGKLLGFEIDGLSQDAAAGIEQLGATIANTLVQAITEGIGRSDVAGIASSLGTAIGAFFGPEGAAVGGLVGNLLGSIASTFGEDSASTKARKSADKFFADMFDANRLSIIVGNEVKQIRDLVFQGDTLFGGENREFGSIENSPFAYLQTLPAAAQAAFAAVGTAFEELLDVGEDIGGQLAAVFANNVGGELNNLQLLVQSTGKSFEDLAGAVFEAFYAGLLTVQELQSALGNLQDIMTVGIPGAVGAVDQAISNLQTALQNERPGRALFDALQDIGAEAQELGRKDFPALVQQIAQAFGGGAAQVQLFFQAMKLAGINSIEELVKASNAQLAALAANVQQAAAGENPTNTAAQIPGQEIGSNSNFAAPRVPSGGGGSSSSSAAKSKKQKEEEEKRRREQLQAEIRRLLEQTDAYKNTINSLTAGQISSAEAGRRISNLYEQTRINVKALKDAQNAYNKELAKTKPNLGALGELAGKIAELQNVLNPSKIKSFDPALLTPLLNNTNALGIAMKDLGVNAEDAGKSIINSFKAGTLNINDAAKELERVKNIAATGIPDAIGDVTGAFNNVLKGGEFGGAFQLDALSDIAAEAQEKFLAKAVPDRLEEFKRLTKEFDSARASRDRAISAGATAEEVDTLGKKLDFARKSLQDFSSTVPQAGIQDLRQELLLAFDPKIVNGFFGALDAAGITSLKDLETASDATKIALLGDFDKSSNALKETANDVTLINQQLAALRGTKVGVEIELSTNALDAIAQLILDELGYGKESVNNTTETETPTTGGTPGLSSAEQRELTRLNKARSKGKLSAKDRARFEELRRKNKLATGAAA